MREIKIRKGTGEYESYSGKTVGNNVYMDRKGKNIIFRWGRLALKEIIFSGQSGCLRQSMNRIMKESFI